MSVVPPESPATMLPLPVSDEDVFPSVTARRRFLRRFLRQRLAIVALGFLLVISAAALAAPVLPIADPNAQNFELSFQGASWAHPLGTDWDGRDLLSRMIHGARISLIAALISVGTAVVLGVPIGLFAGYLGGALDLVASRLADALLSFPFFIIAVSIIGILGAGLTNAMLAVGVLFSPIFFRIVRSSVLAVREETYVEAARATGCSGLRIVRVHVLPNVLSPLLIQIALFMGIGLLAEAGLSFLGLGVQPPDASWGSMIGLGFGYIYDSSWVIFLPGFGVMLTVLAFNLLADGLRDSLGGQMKKGL